MRNYGVLKKEHHDETLSEVTVKGAKYNLVSKLQLKLNEKQITLKELKQEQKVLQSNGKDLNEEDMVRMKRLEYIVANLKNTIDQQVKMFNLKIK